ncbi:MAG: hypothetical protein IJ758_04675 [Clostridia bacterium]|nr:hypothetical protein [Clostridia bacterium]
MKTKVFNFSMLISIVILAILNIFKLLSGDGTIWGFSEYTSNSIVFFTALVGITIVLISSRFINFKDSELVFGKNSYSIIFSAASIIVAIAIACNSTARLIDYICTYRNIIQLVLAIFGFLSTATFIMITLRTLKNNDIFKNKEFLTLFPVFWSIIRLYERYTVYSATSNYPWEMADEILVILSMVFILYQSKIFANIASKNRFKNMIAFGYSYIIFYFTFFNAFTKPTSYIEFSNNLIDSALFIFITFFIIINKNSLLHKVTPSNDTPDVPEA